MIVFCRKIHHLLELDFELNVDFKIGCVKTDYILVFEEFEPSSEPLLNPNKQKETFGNRPYHHHKKQTKFRHFLSEEIWLSRRQNFLIVGMLDWKQDPQVRIFKKKFATIKFLFVTSRNVSVGVLRKGIEKVNVWR